jgi:hypothetical protein
VGTGRKPGPTADRKVGGHGCGLRHSPTAFRRNVSQR